jgi:hypothetical protein
MKDAMWMPTLTAAEPDEMCAADEMRVTRADDGTWAVMTAAGVVLAGGVTNEQAWRWHDRANHEPTSRREDTAAWVHGKDITSL